MTARRSPPLAVGLAVLGGLLLVAATSGDWVTVEEVRAIGGVPLTEEQGTAGTELAPQGLALGVLAALLGLALVLGRGRTRRLLGLLLLVDAALAAAAVASGTIRAVSEPGRLGAGPWVAAVGTIAVLAAGVVAWRLPAPRPALGSRYSIDSGEPEDGEWSSASGEP